MAKEILHSKRERERVYQVTCGDASLDTGLAPTALQWGLPEISRTHDMETDTGIKGVMDDDACRVVLAPFAIFKCQVRAGFVDAVEQVSRFLLGGTRESFPCQVI